MKVEVNQNRVGISGAYMKSNFRIGIVDKSESTVTVVNECRQLLNT